jgi:5-methylcytosine-specific restriction endonuclease McrA
MVSITKVLHNCVVCGGGFYPRRTNLVTTCSRTCGLELNGFQARARGNGCRVWCTVKMVSHGAVLAEMDRLARLVDEMRKYIDDKREANRLKPRECGQCSTMFVRVVGSKASKCQACREENKVKRRGLAAVARKGTAARRADKNREKARRRARMDVDAELFDPIEVLSRDGWRCVECGVDTPKKLRGKNKPNSPELDHIIPLSKGGAHTRANTRCLCRSCNADKSDKDDWSYWDIIPI